MSHDKRKYDSTVARIAGNIAAGMMPTVNTDPAVRVADVATAAVTLARLIVAEVERTDPQPCANHGTALCTCQVVSGGFRATSANCPTHGNIERSYASSPQIPPDGNR